MPKKARTRDQHSRLNTLQKFRAGSSQGGVSQTAEGNAQDGVRESGHAQSDQAKSDVRNVEVRFVARCSRRNLAMRIVIQPRVHKNGHPKFSNTLSIQGPLPKWIP